MRAAERRYVNLADHGLAVSEADRGYFSSYADTAKITVIPTGVDIEYFQPSSDPEQSDSLVFTGSMDWLPNEDAIEYFAESILPSLRREVAGAMPQKAKGLAAQPELWGDDFIVGAPSPASSGRFSRGFPASAESQSRVPHDSDVVCSLAFPTDCAFYRVAFWLDRPPPFL